MAAEPYATSVHIAAAAGGVYPYLTQAEPLVRWMGQYAELDPRPGGSSRSMSTACRSAAATSSSTRRTGRHRWGFAGSRAAARLDAPSRCAAGSRGRDAARARAPRPARRPGGRHDAGWSHYLERLGKVAAGRYPGPDPGMSPTPLKNV